MWLDSNLYTWTYQVAKWAWEADIEPEAVLDAAVELLEAAAPRLGDTEAASAAVALVEQMSEVMADVVADMPEVVASAAGANGSLAVAPVAGSTGGLLESLLETVPDMPPIIVDGTSNAEPDAVLAAALALGAVAVAVSEAQADKAHDEDVTGSPSSLPSPLPSPPPLPKMLPPLAMPVLPLPSPVFEATRPSTSAPLRSLQPREATLVTKLSNGTATSAPALPSRTGADQGAIAARGRWVLKGYETRRAFSLHPDPMQQELRRMANDPSDQETHAKYLQRRGQRSTGSAPRSSDQRHPDEPIE